MKIHGCNRQGCLTPRGNLLRYEHILREYRCECGCALITQPVLVDYVVTGYTVHCPDCGQIDTIAHYNQDFENASAAAEVLDNLPEEWRGLIEVQPPPALDITELSKILF